MSGMSDREYLLTDQYKDASNLNARLQIHERFSTNPYGWHRWVFDQFDLSPESRILELGCGPGTLWLKNMDRIPEGRDITLSDFSSGMLRQAEQDLRDSRHPFGFAVADAQAIPFANKSFDAVIANHMLYHVPDRDTAFSEIRRILTPGGRFYASTNGRTHLRELGDLVRRFDPNVPADDGAGVRSSERFGLENGSDQLARWFSDIARRRYEDALVVTEAEPLIDWARSWAGSVFAGDKLTDFFRFLEQEWTVQKAIRVTKDSGIFEAQKNDAA